MTTPSYTFTQLEERLFHQLDEPFRSRALLCAYRLRERIQGDATVQMIVRDAYRDPAEQDRLFRKGRMLDPATGKWQDRKDSNEPIVTKAEAGRSAHEYRRAIHLILIDPVTKHWLGNKDKRWHLIGDVTSLVPSVTWGGSWSSLRDYAHIEDADWKVLAKSRGWVGFSSTERSG